MTIDPAAGRPFPTLLWNPELIFYHVLFLVEKIINVRPVNRARVLDHGYSLCHMRKGLGIFLENREKPAATKDGTGGL